MSKVSEAVERAVRAAIELGYQDEAEIRIAAFATILIKAKVTPEEVLAAMTPADKRMVLCMPPSHFTESLRAHVQLEIVRVMLRAVMDAPQDPEGLDGGDGPESVDIPKW